MSPHHKLPHPSPSHPTQGLNPAWIVTFFSKYGIHAWESLSGVMLCVAGTETMFAAMGHFSQPAIALAFCCFSYPCLMIAYLGQGAYLLGNPQNVSELSGGEI